MDGFVIQGRSPEAQREACRRPFAGVSGCIACSVALSWMERKDGILTGIKGFSVNVPHKVEEAMGGGVALEGIDVTTGK